jgi:RNA polymerase sigma factor (sigma-70 family)
MSAAIAEQLRRLFTGGTVAGLGEVALLERFITRRDPAAFEALVARHGPMVLGICRRLLREPHDIEDAFQATFLVLVRRAGSLRRREALGPWLYGVAYRVAMRARARAAAGPDLSPGIDPPDGRETGPDAAAERSDDASALHEEVARLPESYRAPVVLCYFEGLTHDEAAQQLHWPVGTVRGRLARARDRLRSRLERRGVGPAALAFGPAATHLPVVPPALLESATRLANVGSFRALPAPGVVSLAQGAINMMVWSQLRTSAVLAVGLVVLGAGIVWSAGQGAGSQRKPANERPAPVNPRVRPQPEPARGNQSPPEPAKGKRQPPLDRTDLPMLGDEDTTAKIRVALENYDKELKSLTDAFTEQEAHLGLLQAQIEAIEAEMTEVEGVMVKVKHGLEAPVGAGRDIDAYEKNVKELKLSLQETMKEAARARLRLDDTRRRLNDLKSRPRPSERVEVQIGDKLIIEVVEALPGRPISGERVVRADGKISLGFYGELYVAGMTPMEIKEKVIYRMRKFLPDEVLGLVEAGEGGKVLAIPPRDSNRVFVDIEPHPSTDAPEIVPRTSTPPVDIRPWTPSGHGGRRSGLNQRPQ